MLFGFVLLYLFLSVGIGLWAALKVKNTRDFAVAGRHLSFPVVTATVFATWFGAETVLGLSATFLQEGLSATASDPFGASMCLIFAGLFFARKLYRLNLLTIGDFFRIRYNRVIEILATVCIVVSYLGWVSAQIRALGLVFAVISGGKISEHNGMILGALIVLTYTVFGGMLSVAVLDFVQMIVIMAGLLGIGWYVTTLPGVGGLGNVVHQAASQGKFVFFPRQASAWMPFIAAWLTMMLGSIPQQDVFQRMTSAKDEDTAVYSTVLGGGLYFVFAFVPMLLAFTALLVAPEKFQAILAVDAQKILPTLILEHTPLFAQVLFFGALLSAIMSTSSATLLAPSITFSENILKGFFPQISDVAFLRMIRMVLLVFALCVLYYALQSDSSIHKMVENAYKITLVAAFVPLTAGLFWKKATTQGALAAMLGGLGVWLAMEIFLPKPLLEVWPPQLGGLLTAILAMLIGSLLPQWYQAKISTLESEFLQAEHADA
ncbi:sodium:solute symporter [bacterium (Candidatus Blackallbacteria) CG17_big_fil_post_rev_8_21_14_2_50_48_46]|uniref:Sodium:solute symporter n=1 Tax=bacterium (Candidatus Blackallbacteria) CG17_big_fil_post_rev_8_21_14_2_50_48_46 TaxID=2014261 RepID=A0A2M7G250_9BACT|nr:MAG: sodium:solute symporter [bacterium (Candidatus Blackallbacteria) CG18_big_fil_WC_8_21_14_2_50_49_26]PIW15640.1 MAG: sodium:solute symporter [bacterium (Candidatus Blackallbacteria) CG17_big_fil_post_rev_8_21_14_2_50_48_46]